MARTIKTNPKEVLKLPKVVKWLFWGFVAFLTIKLGTRFLAKKPEDSHPSEIFKQA
jgi:hypothetical protein